MKGQRLRHFRSHAFEFAVELLGFPRVGLIEAHRGDGDVGGGGQEQGNAIHVAGEIDEDKIVAAVIPQAVDQGVDVDVGGRPLLHLETFNKVDAGVALVPAVKGFGLVEVDDAGRITLISETRCQRKAGE